MPIYSFIHLIGFRMAIPQHCYSRLACSMYTNGMKRAFVWEFPIGNLTGVATTPTGTYAHIIPTLTTQCVRLCDAVCIEPLMTAEWCCCGTAVDRLCFQ